MSDKRHQSATAAPSTAPSAQAASPQADIDYDALEGLMSALQEPTPDTDACLALFQACGERGQELVLADATMGPKIRAMHDQGDEGSGSWWDQIGSLAEGALDAASGAVEAARGAANDMATSVGDTVRSAGDAASGALGEDWDPRNHPILKNLAALPEQALETGRAVWGAEADRDAPTHADRNAANANRAAEVEPIPVPDLGPQVVTRPGEPMFETAGDTGYVKIRGIEPVEVVEAVQIAGKDDHFGARVEDRYHIRSTADASVDIDHWVRFGALSTDAELNQDFAAQDQIPLDQLSGASRGVARIWNEKGGFIDARRGALSRAIAVAVMKVESGGLGYSGSGEMVIRFENHKLWSTGEGISKSWGKSNPDTFHNHFRPHRGAAEHQINVRGADEGGEWESFHGSQAMEWKALQLAIDASEDPEAAYCAISMGAGQVMGFNANKLGYGSAVEMFESFRDDASANLGGVFSFIETNPEAKAALQTGDFTAFVQQYNGNGPWVQTYVDLLTETVSAFEALERTHLASEQS